MWKHNLLRNVVDYLILRNHMEILEDIFSFQSQWGISLMEKTIILGVAGSSLACPICLKDKSDKTTLG